MKAASSALVVLALLAGTAIARSSTPGSVLSSEPRPATSLADVGPTVAPLYARSGMPAPKYGVDRYRLKVSSTDEQGNPITVSALLYVPQTPQGRVPLYVMGPGTTGLADACAPTREQSSSDNWGNYEAHMLSYAAQGYVAILPDWANFDDASRVQPYFVAAAEGRIMLDAARAARTFLARSNARVQPNGSVYLAGFSQGGHAAFSATDLAASYAPELNIRGVIGYAPAMDVATLFRERPALGPYLTASYAAYYGVKPEKIIADRWLPTLRREATQLCVTGVYRYYPNDARSIYRPEFLAALNGGSVQSFDRDLARLLKRNAPGFETSGRQVPALVITGLTDPIVTADAQLSFMRKSCAFGRTILQIGYENANHFQARQFGFRDTLAWMAELEAGKVAPTSCLDAKYQMPGETSAKQGRSKGTPVFVDKKR